MKTRLIYAALAIPFLVAACGSDGKQAVGVPDIMALREAATRLAEREIERLQALEEPRKEELIRSPTMNPFTVGTTGIWARVYREYTDFEIKDIRLKDSLLHPVEFEITYKYKVFTTPGRNDDFVGAKDLADAEREFEFRREASLDLVYQADLAGEVTELPKDPLHEQYHPREFTKQLPGGEEIEGQPVRPDD